MSDRAKTEIKFGGDRCGPEEEEIEMVWSRGKEGRNDWIKM